jgi:hypothetical protein
VVPIGRRRPGEAPYCCLPAGHNSREVAIHVPLGAPSGVPAVPMEVTLDNRKGNQLGLKCHGWRGPAVVVTAACTPSRLTPSLLLKPCGGIKTERLEGRSRLVLGRGGGEGGEKCGRVGTVGGDQGRLGEVQIYGPRRGIGSLVPEAQRWGAVM